MNSRSWLVISVLLITLALYVHFRPVISVEPIPPAISQTLRPSEPVASTVVPAPAESTTHALPTAGEGNAVPAAPKPHTTTVPGGNPDQDESALYEELHQINERMTADLQTDIDDEVPVDAESELIGFQSELMNSATKNPQEAEFAAGLLDKCGRDSTLLQGVRLVCAGNLKRLAQVFPEKAGSRYQELLQTLPREDAEQLSDPSDRSLNVLPHDVE